jgi:hypothetical protein
MAQEHPAIFRPFLSELFVKESDPVFNRIQKLEVLTSICTKENIQSILSEFQVYIKHANIDYVCAVIRALGRAADVDNEVAGKCTDGLLQLISFNKNPAVVQQCVIVIRQLIQQNSGTAASHKALNVLAKLMIAEEGGITDAIARANIVWLVGEYHDVIITVAPDLLRLLLINFIDEATETKTQILNFAIKMALKLPDDDLVQSLMTYVLEMSRYDMDTDLRDRSRLMTALMGLAPSAEGEDGEGGNSAAAAVDEYALEQLTERAKEIMLAAKLPPVTLNGAVDVEALPDFTVGSLSSLVGHYVSGYQPVQHWPITQPDPSVRDTLMRDDGDGPAPRPASGAHTKKGDDIKGFYDKDEKSDTSESESDSGSEEEESENSDADSDEESGSGSGSDAESSSEEESDSESESESEKESDEESEEEEEAIRVPIAHQTVKTRQAVRKVGGGSGAKKTPGSSDSSGIEGLLSGMGSIDLMTMGNTNTSSSSSSSIGGNSSSSTNLFTSAVAPGASFAGAMDDLSDIFPPSQPIAQPNFDVFGDLDASPGPSAPAAAGGPQKNSPVSGMGMMPGGNNMMMPPQQQQQFNQIGSPMNPQQMQQQQQMWQQQQLLQMQQMGMNNMGGGNMGGMGTMGNMNMGNNMGNMGGMGGGMGNMGMNMGMNPGMQQQQPMNPMGMNLSPNSIANNLGSTTGVAMNKNPSAGNARPGSATNAATPGAVDVSSSDEILSESKDILSPDLSGGLAVSMVYRYSSEPVAYSGAHCVYFVVKNASTDRNIR